MVTAPSGRPSNLLVIMSDEHQARISGCYGHPVIRTPNIDALAARGTRFQTAYTNSPVCIPARANFATGRYLHQMGFWDNADPYDGTVETWHHVLRAAGHRVDSIGKLHFRGLPGEDYGFSREHVPMHVIEGKGDLMGLVRDELPVRKGAWKMAGMAGPGEGPYTIYDRDITARAQVWLREEAPKQKEKPWALFVSLVAPHFPLTAPPEHFYRYFDDPALPLPKLYRKDGRARHPYIEEYAYGFPYDDHFEGENGVRRAIAGYFGLCAFLDENIGKILNALDASGAARDTTVVYTSDHGDNLGARGVWGKSTMYEESAAIPCVIAGPLVPRGRVSSTPVSLIDVFPTALDAVGLGEAIAARKLPGRSLIAVANQADAPDRVAFSEYHGMGSTSGVFMVRVGRFKYVHYTKYQPQLFDLAADPDELIDLAGNPAHAADLRRCQEALAAICDPVEVDGRVRARQAELLAANGGREAVIARGDLGFTPPPGVTAAFN
ncbi:MAG: sulfatase-like hydrolase/transferase [Pseudomonadota bacterium]